MTYREYFFLYLLLTLAIEIPFLFATTKYLLKIKLPAGEIFYWGVFANLFSYPYLWFVFPLFIRFNRRIYFEELLVAAIEAIVLSKGLKINFKKALILSLVANAASYFIGLIILK